MFIRFHDPTPHVKIIRLPLQLLTIYPATLIYGSTALSHRTEEL